MRISLIAVAAFVVCVAAPPAGAAPITLPTIVAADLQIKLTLLGSTTPGNIASPVAVGNDLLLINQGTATLTLRAPDGSTTTLLAAAGAPAGLSLIGQEKILNATANESGDKVYVTFTSSTAPPGAPLTSSPRPNVSGYQVIYEYDFDGAALSNPQPIRAFEVNTTGHTGGGMLALGDGPLLLAFGDNGDAFEDGRSFAQDGSSHLSKIVSLDPDTGATTVLAQGVRNVQRFELATHGGLDYLDFVDIGGNIVEELNRVLLSDLLDPGAVENFGWGRNAGDNLAREGTYYIAPDGSAAGDAPIGEPGFYQPAAQWGRETPGFFAGSGPASCSSFSGIQTLLGDLPTGNVYATIDESSTGPQNVYRVAVLDEFLQTTTLFDLAGGRPDPRFFCFDDGSAGVLLERTGAIYQIDEVSSVPEPGSLALLATGLVCAACRRLRLSGFAP
jgi:hypothetical protein